MKQQYKTFLIWALWVGIVFFSIYPTMNWITHFRHEHYPMFFDFELAIPLVPQFIWIYFSLYVLFITPPFFLDSPALEALGKRLIIGTVLSGIIFLLFPGALGFSRIVPEDPFYHSLFTALFFVDYPHNLVPSLHVLYSSAIIFPIVQHNKIHIKLLFIIWLVLIANSAILVHQHHIIDVVSALVLVIMLHFSIKESRNLETL